MVFILITVTMILGFMSSVLPFPARIKRFFSLISVYWMSIFVYLLLFNLIADVIIFISGYINVISKPIPQNVIFYSGSSVIFLTAGFVGYGLYNATRLHQTSYEIKLANNLLNNLKIVLISDSHLGAANRFERDLEIIIQSINDMKPDIVCWTGDIFNGDFYAMKNPDRTSSLLNKIESTYGVFACPGNHDAGATFGQMVEFLKKSNVHLLVDEYTTIDERFVLIGRFDSSPIGDAGGIKRKDISDILSTIDSNLPVIVMDHNPGSIGEYDDRINLILAGHTHKGQIFPFSYITRAIFDVDYGHYQKNKNNPHVIVTSGLSTWGPPLRIGTKNEIVKIIVQ